MHSYGQGGYGGMNPMGQQQGMGGQMMGNQMMGQTGMGGQMMGNQMMGQQQGMGGQMMGNPMMGQQGMGGQPGGMGGMGSQMMGNPMMGQQQGMGGQMMGNSMMGQGMGGQMMGGVQQGGMGGQMMGGVQQGGMGMGGQMMGGGGATAEVQQLKDENQKLKEEKVEMKTEIDKLKMEVEQLKKLLASGGGASGGMNQFMGGIGMNQSMGGIGMNQSMGGAGGMNQVNQSGGGGGMNQMGGQMTQSTSAPVSTPSSQRDPDPIREPKPTTVTTDLAFLAETGTPFMLENTDQFIFLHRFFCHTDSNDMGCCILLSKWDEMEEFELLHVYSKLLRWQLQKVAGSSDRYTLSPYILPTLHVNYAGRVTKKHASKIDIALRIQPGTGPNAPANSFTLTWIKEKAVLTSFNTTGGQAGVFSITGQPNLFHSMSEASTYWRFYPAPYTFRQTLPRIDIFAKTQIPFLLCTEGNAYRFGNFSMVETHLENETLFNLVPCVWEGQAGYRLVTATGTALKYAFHSNAEFGSTGDPDTCFGIFQTVQSEPYEWDARSFVTFRPGALQGRVQIQYPNTDGDCILDSSSQCMSECGMTNMIQRSDLSSTSYRKASWVLMPYGHNPADWPADPDLSEFVFTMEWGKESFLFISAETLPLVPGTKLVVEAGSSRPGTRWIIEPIADKPKYFRIISADNPALCMCVESIDEDTHVTLTDKRDENTIMTCEVNDCGVWHAGKHHYKFECSDLYLNVRRVPNKFTVKPGFYLVQECKDVSTSFHENSAFRLANSGVIVDMTGRPNGDLREIYKELDPEVPDNLCLCGTTLESAAALAEHKLECAACQPLVKRCQHCCGNVPIYGVRSWRDHMRVCSNERPNECLRCTMLFRSPKELEEHGAECKGFFVQSAFTPTQKTPEEEAAIKATKDTLAKHRKSCPPGAGASILVCAGCKKKKGCIFCGSGKDQGQVKSCRTCREKKGGGHGKVSAKPNHISAGCIHCGTNTGITYYFSCQKCANTYGSSCCYNYILNEL